MTSQTEKALQALVAALTAKAASEGATIIAPLRNNALPARLFDAGAGLEKYLNVWDGDGETLNEALGADSAGMLDGYELAQRPLVEWVVAGGTDETREAAFDAGLIDIHDAIKADSEGRYLAGVTDENLAGVVHQAAIEAIARQGGKSLVTDGMPNIKAAELTIRLTFMSSRPF
jgi:hypothetical protein